jgi:hypothetical protein
LDDSYSKRVLIAMSLLANQVCFYCCCYCCCCLSTLFEIYFFFCQNKAVGDAIGDLLLVAAILMDLLQRHNADADNGMFHSHLFCESTINVVL